MRILYDSSRETLYLRRYPGCSNNYDELFNQCHSEHCTCEQQDEQNHFKTQTWDDELNCYCTRRCQIETLEQLGSITYVEAGTIWDETAKAPSVHHGFREEVLAHKDELTFMEGSSLLSTWASLYTVPQKFAVYNLEFDPECWEDDVLRVRREFLKASEEKGIDSAQAYLEWEECEKLGARPSVVLDMVAIGKGRLTVFLTPRQMQQLSYSFNMNWVYHKRHFWDEPPMSKAMIKPRSVELELVFPLLGLPPPKTWSARGISCNIEFPTCDCFVLRVPDTTE